MNIIEIPFKIIELDDQQNIMLMVNALIGEYPINLVIDTGASHSCLSKKSVKNLTEKTTIKADVVVGIGRGKLRNKLVNVPNFKIGDLEIDNYPFLILPLAHINKMLSSIGMKTIDGFLGSDILYAYKAKIDYNSRIIQLQTTNNE
jgi:predicted aspartyl protease